MLLVPEVWNELYWSLKFKKRSLLVPPFNSVSYLPMWLTERWYVIFLILCDTIKIDTKATNKKNHSWPDPLVLVPKTFHCLYQITDWPTHASTVLYLHFRHSISAWVVWLTLTEQTCGIFQGLCHPKLSSETKIVKNTDYTIKQNKPKKLISFKEKKNP